MAPSSTMFLLPASLLVLVSRTVADMQSFPTAIRKQSPDSGNKILAEHLAFAPFLQVGPYHGHASFLDEQDLPSNETERFSPAFAQHIDEREESLLRRAAQALDLLKKSAACPSGMNSCGDSGSPNKCCQQGTYCTAVPDTDVGHVACCPSGSTCGGGIGKCPADATACPAALGGGCCIPGYACQGVGCVPSASSTPTVVPTTKPQETVTSTKTTVIEGNPTTVIVTVTQTASPEVTTQTTTQVVVPTKTNTAVITNTNTDSATGNPPWRPTGTSEVNTAPQSTTALTQTGCPTGFYGCLATHGGGCCRTDRDCQTYSCPPPSSTTLVSDGATIVVPATNMPTSTGSATCAGGWFLCGKDAGAAAGCCPSGYECGTASCFTAGATVTGKVQKQAPDQSSATKNVSIVAASWVLLTLALLF